MQLTMISILIMGLSPIRAEAEWKQNNGCWWYTEGSSWAIGWRLIDGNWYYFNKYGYMEHDNTIDGYYLNSNGAWSTNILDEQGRYKEGTIVTLSGTLNEYFWEHPAQGKLSFCVLKLDEPANFNVIMLGDRKIYDGVKEIQVIADFNNDSNNYKELYSKVGQHVNLKGRIWGGAGTWYYRRDVTMTWLEDK